MKKEKIFYFKKMNIFLLILRTAAIIGIIVFTSLSLFFGTVELKPGYIFGDNSLRDFIDSNKKIEKSTSSESNEGTLTQQDLDKVAKILSGQTSNPEEIYNFFKGLTDKAREKLFSTLDAGYDPKEFFTLKEWFVKIDKLSPEDREEALFWDTSFVSCGTFNPRDNKDLQKILSEMDEKQAYDYLKSLSEKERQEALKYLDAASFDMGDTWTEDWWSQLYKDLNGMSEQERKDMYAKADMMDKLEAEVSEEMKGTLTQQDLDKVAKILSGQTSNPEEIYNFFKGLTDKAREKLFSTLDAGYDPKEFFTLKEWFVKIDKLSPEDREEALFWDTSFVSCGTFNPRDNKDLQKILSEMDEKQAYDYLKSLSEKERQEALKYLDAASFDMGDTWTEDWWSQLYKDLNGMSEQERKDMYAKADMMDKLEAEVSEEMKGTLTQQDLDKVAKILSGQTSNPEEIYNFFKGLTDKAREKLFSTLDAGYDPKEFFTLKEWFVKIDKLSPEDREEALFWDTSFVSCGTFNPRDNKDLQKILSEMDEKQAYDYLKSLSEKERQEALKYLDAASFDMGDTWTEDWWSQLYKDLNGMSEQERKDMYAKADMMDKLEAEVSEEMKGTLTQQDLDKVAKILSGQTSNPEEIYNFFKGLTDKAREKLFSTLDAGYDPKEFFTLKEWFVKIDKLSPEDREEALFWDTSFVSCGTFNPRDNKDLQKILSEMDEKQAYDYLKSLSEKERQEALKYLDAASFDMGDTWTEDWWSQLYKDLNGMSEQERKDMYAKADMMDKLEAELIEPDNTSVSDNTESDASLIHGVIPTKVTAHGSGGTSNLGGWDIYFEFWNVGKLGGEQYAKATCNEVLTKPAEGVKQNEPIVFEGYFTGGPNGDMYLTFTWEGGTEQIHFKLKNGKEIISDNGVTIPIDNPGAFNGWQD